MLSYRARIVATDVGVVCTALLVPQLLLHPDGLVGVHLVVLAVVAAIWCCALAIFDSRSPRALGTGFTEYKAVVDATFVALGVVVLLAFAFRIALGRSDIIPATPVGLAFLLVGRWSWRQWLRRQRALGYCLSRAVLVGSAESIAHTTAQLDRHPDSGYVVVGSLLAADSPSEDLGLHERLVRALTENGADTVMLTSSDALTPQRIRGLAWELEQHHHRLVITPSLTDVAESRIQTQPVAGLPLIHILSPNYTGPQRVTKRILDIVGSSALLIVFAPAMLGIGAAVRLTSKGSVFYRQVRVGKGDRPFGILKFRSMVADADARLAELLIAQGTADTPLFKVQSDPRLTRVGSVLRRYSLDELPQLINVFRGEMSLVGPRPQRPAEVALYDSAAQRRLKVRPGMTGLWQVSGRSRLTWEESLRLDLYYIENWTLMVDIIILWRTFRAVVGSDGAY